MSACLSPRRSFVRYQDGHVENPVVQTHTRFGAAGARCYDCILQTPQTGSQETLLTQLLCVGIAVGAFLIGAGLLSIAGLKICLALLRAIS
jgi:hypothetical protein